MNELLLAIIIMAGVLILFTLARGKRRSGDYPYQSLKYLLSKSERSFYGVLVSAVGDTGLVFSKVRVADVIAPRKNLNRVEWTRSFNAISAKHFDFLICSNDDCSIKLAIELDDSSHSSGKREKRDDLLNRACQSAGLPLLRVKASKAYVMVDIQRQIKEAISPRTDATKPGPVDPITKKAGAELTNEATMSLLPESASRQSDEHSALSTEVIAASAAPCCPVCGATMVRRTARAGTNAGREFWGCSTFPKCRGVIEGG